MLKKLSEISEQIQDPPSFSAIHSFFAKENIIFINTVPKYELFNYIKRKLQMQETLKDVKDIGVCHHRNELLVYIVYLKPSLEIGDQI